MIVHALVVVCGSTWCEPTVLTYTLDRYYYDYSGPDLPVTEEACREGLGLRDFARLSPETKDIYYLDPRKIGVPGLTFVPDASACWPLRKGPV